MVRHKFIPRWDKHEKGFYCTECGVLKEEHGPFDLTQMLDAPMSKNAKLLEMFTAYCKANPEMRFWQALCNWSGYNILASFNVPGGSQQWDTFNMEDDFKNWPQPDNRK